MFDLLNTFKFFSSIIQVMTSPIILVGLTFNLIASVLIGYGRIFRSKKTIQKESQTADQENTFEEKQRLLETRIAQMGVVLLTIGFAVQIWGYLTDN
jgi:hypothetical protein